MCIRDRRRLNLLFFEEDDECPRPSQYAHEQANSLLLNAWRLLQESGEEMPRPSISTDEDGGIYISWRKGAGSVMVLVPDAAESRGYIDEIVGDRPVERDVTAQALADCLTRFSAYMCAVQVHPWQPRRA